VIRIENVHVELGGFCLEDIDLSVDKGEFFILLGPTGAGKTVLLEALAGLLPTKKGRVLIDGADVTNLPPEKRGIGIVYQDCALFPHLTVLQNITYGLHFHRINKTEAEKRLDGLLDQLGLRFLTDRMPVNLSGGELQRVALARALMVSPSVLSLDEPLSSLDPNFRGEIQEELKRLHQESGITFLMVTHDFCEALSLGSRGAVINKGKIEQVGKLTEIFQKPDSPFVADFVGMKNLFPAKFSGTTAFVHDLGLELGREAENSCKYIGIRPEDIIISRQMASPEVKNSFNGVVSKILNRGFFYEIHVKADGILFNTFITKGWFAELEPAAGLPVNVSIKPEAIHPVGG